MATLGRRQKRARREAAEEGGDSDLSVVSVGAAYQWRCGICGEPVARGDASIDHLQPLCEGGAHRWENVQLAHITCNERKNRLEWKVRFYSPRIRRRAAQLKLYQLLTLLVTDHSGYVVRDDCEPRARWGYIASMRGLWQETATEMLRSW